MADYTFFGPNFRAIIMWESACDRVIMGPRGKGGSKSRIKLGYFGRGAFSTRFWRRSGDSSVMPYFVISLGERRAKNRHLKYKKKPPDPGSTKVPSSILESPRQGNFFYCTHFPRGVGEAKGRLQKLIMSSFCRTEPKEEEEVVEG